MLHCLDRGDSEVLVVDQHALDKVEGLGVHQVLVPLVDILLEVLLGVALQELGDRWRHSDFVLANVRVEVIGAHHLCDSNQLVIVVRALKEGVHAEDHAGKSAAETPNIERIVVELVVYKELRAFVVATGHSHVVLL